VRILAVLVATAASFAGGCGGDARAPSPPEAPVRPPDHVVPQRPLATGPRLVEHAPEWVQAFCAEVERRSGLGCPRSVPSGFASVDLPQERPSRRGFTLVGSYGWTIRGDARARGPRLAAARVRARGEGIVLRWSRYAIAVERSAGPRLQRQVRAVARSIGRG
jgi:hypothetical protein